MTVSLPAPCVQILVPLVLENPLTGMRCIVDAKVDTGSFATVISSATLEKLQLSPFTEDWVALANGDPARSVVCMCRAHLSEEETLDLPVYVMDSDNEQALLGMDILSLGNFNASHYQSDDGQMWLRFSFSFLDDSVPPLG